MARAEVIHGPSGAKLHLVLSEADVRTLDSELSVNLRAGEPGFPAALAAELVEIKLLVEVE